MLIPILALSSIVFRTWLPLRNADAAGIALEERFGSPGSFVPDPHGETRAERMQAFLNVRRSVMEFCPRFEALEARVRHFRSETNEEEAPTGREIVKVTRSIFGALGDLTPLVGAFFSRRNKVLLESETGVGECVYPFTVSHGEALAGLISTVGTSEVRARGLPRNRPTGRPLRS